MNDWYIMRLESKKRGNMDIYKKTLRDMFDKELSWNEVKELSREDQMKLTFELDRNIKIAKSPLDISKLARTIQRSRSGAGGCALTEFECSFCGEKEVWSNTNTPNICRKCSTDMATSIVLMEADIFKDK